MNEDKFWQIIAASRSKISATKADGNFAIQSSALRKLLSAITEQDQHKFCEILNRLYNQSYSWDLWGAAYIINGGCSDDGFADFRGWLISMGHQVFQWAIDDAESLCSVYKDKSIESFFYPEFLSIPNCYFQIDWKKHPSGQELDIEKLETRFPKLWSTFSKA